MPLSPTPLSGCPLRILEIHGSTPTVYDAAQSELALTATLEARRSMTGDKNDLMLQAHLGLRRVLSIRLTDLFTSSCDTAEVVTIDKPRQQMCIQIHQQRQNVLFTFKETRDFNIVVYTLKKFGFRMKEGVAPLPHIDIASLPRSQSSPTISSTNFGPRLSSITPLQLLGSSQVQSPFSFTSMLNSGVPLAEMQSLDIQHQQVHQLSPQGQSQQPTTPMVPVAPYAPDRNANQLHLGYPGNMYQPQVGSPLRNVVEVNSQDTSPRPPTLNNQPRVFPNATPTEFLSSCRSISEPNALSQSWKPPECVNTNRCGSPNFQQSLQGSQDTIISSGSDSQATDETDISFSSQSTQDFRELMPQTRNLPFVKDSKNKPSRTKAMQKQANIRQGQSGSNFDMLVEETAPSSCNDDNPNISQTDLRPISSQPTDSQAKDALACHSPFEGGKLPAMLIIDNNLLENINQVTSKLLDQFIEDIARGCDYTACARYYLERIDTARREFWLNQLKQINYM
ncbi:hypothetical protein TrVFT333_007454 [Trichoderma virens FT-333]|nr:hypothetical protein TrVFT333_007454 [Trichoderma virens FT-333]